MKEHQKYFHLVDSSALLPYFITLANLVSNDPAQVIAGNEKVIRPRLSDAAFSSPPTAKRRLPPSGKNSKPLCSKPSSAACSIKRAPGPALRPHGRSTRLGCKPRPARRRVIQTDLVSKMVYEFAEMQGIAGYYYARNDGEPQEVAEAL